MVSIKHFTFNLHSFIESKIFWEINRNYAWRQVKWKQKISMWRSLSPMLICEFVNQLNVKHRSIAIFKIWNTCKKGKNIILILHWSHHFLWQFSFVRWSHLVEYSWRRSFSLLVYWIESSNLQLLSCIVNWHIITFLRRRRWHVSLNFLIILLSCIKWPPNIGCH